MSRDRIPPQVVAERWQDLLDDATATATEYENDGWETLVIHTADATVLDGETYGLNVLAPDNEYERLQSLAEGTTFDNSHVFHAEDDGVRFLLVAVEATAAEIAVLVPAYMPLDETPGLRQRADSEGVMYTHVRPLGDDTQVTFSHEDPSLFF